MGIRLDENMNKVENKLSQISAIPIVGTLAGATKFVIGAAQAFTALAMTVLTSIPCTVKGDWSAMKYSWTHVKHGAGNMVAGVIEAIPIVQTVLWGARKHALSKALDARSSNTIITHHENKFMPYKTLVAKDLTFGGIDKEEMQGLFNERIVKMDGPITPERKIQLAKQVVFDHRVYDDKF